MWWHVHKIPHITNTNRKSSPEEKQNHGLASSPVLAFCLKGSYVSMKVTALNNVQHLVSFCEAITLFCYIHRPTAKIDE